MNELLQKVRDYADKAHGEQMRKYADERYIHHPVRVMKMCSQYTDDNTILAAALLHDVLEDTPVTKGEMQSFLKTIMTNAEALRTTKLVVELTDVYIKEDYPRLNRRSRKSKELQRLETTGADSQTVKYADIIDNSSKIVDDDPDFAKVYLMECRTLLKKLDKGNQELYRQATEAINYQLSRLKKKDHA